MTPLRVQLSARVGEAFEKAGLDPSYGAVRVSDRPDLAPFQCNGALAAAKHEKTNPRALAETVAEHVRADSAFCDVSIAGPGFINLTLARDFLVRGVQSLAEDPHAGAWRTGEPRTVVVDYGGPNIAKPMHVGHLRSSIIGESLKRLFRAVGDKAIGDIHLGDWGLPMGMLISELARRHPDWAYFSDDTGRGLPETPPFDMDELEVVYPEAAAACKTDEARMEEARAATAALQAGHPGYHGLWRHFLMVTRERLETEFKALGVFFDLWKGEADVAGRIAGMIEDLSTRGIAHESEGALIIDVARESDGKALPPMLLRKSDGAATYATTDLATILDRAETLDPDLFLYVVDHRQSLHFRQVFRAADLAGYAREDALEHIAYGTMNGEDGKPFKTREGGVMRLRDLNALMRAAVRARLEESGAAKDYTQEELEDIASKVGLGALKFADLSHERSSDYVFNPKSFTRFEGRTGPYLQYAAVRIQAMLARAGDEADAARPHHIVLDHPEEQGLALALLSYGDAVAAAYDRRAPHLLCDHAYSLAQTFSKFYSVCPVATAEDSDVRASRLALSKATLGQFRHVFQILGLDIPERM